MDPKRLEEKAQEIQYEIAGILLHDWDPIGVRDIRADEYESYVGGIYRLLASGAAPEAIAEHLSALETEEMGLSRNRRADLLAVARKLCDLVVG